MLGAQPRSTGSVIGKLHRDRDRGVVVTFAAVKLQRRRQPPQK
jgi:hypothetical protein